MAVICGVVMIEIFQGLDEPDTQYFKRVKRLRSISRAKEDKENLRAFRIGYKKIWDKMRSDVKEYIEHC